MGRINTTGSGSGGMTWVLKDKGVLLAQGTSQVDVTIATVDITKAVVKLSGVNSQTIGRVFGVVPQLINSTTLRLDGLVSYEDVYYEVYEVEGAASIQFITNTRTATSTGPATYNISISNVDPDKSIVIMYDRKANLNYTTASHGVVDATGDNLTVTTYDEDTDWRVVNAYIIESK